MRRRAALRNLRSFRRLRRDLVLARVCVAGVIAAGAAALTPGTARADVDIAGQAPADAAPARPRRPRMAVAIGMGATFDTSGFQPDGAHAIPSFAAVGDVGEGLVGFGMGVYATAASGRYPGTDYKPVDRLGLDLMAVLRLLATRFAPTDIRYRARVARASGFELGLGYERDGQATLAGGRFGIHTGARLELPLTRAREATELRLQLAVRRLLGLYEPVVGTTSVHDSTQLYAALAVSF